jgi:hypothetical protein
MKKFLVKWFKLGGSHTDDEGVYRPVLSHILGELDEGLLAVLSIENLVGSAA